MQQLQSVLAGFMLAILGVWSVAANAQTTSASPPAAPPGRPTPGVWTPPPKETDPPAKPAVGTAVVVEDDNPEEVEEVVVVVSASKTAQTIEEAPSIITAVTRREIQRQGYRTLAEVLRNTVGFGINDNGHWPDTGVRGINDRTTYGDKIQFLVDGHNMSWRQFNRNLHNPTWADMGDIERIEIIRGPGAAIWGSNALTGVVNIVTRDWTTLNGAEVTYGGDHRFGSQFISARVGKALGDLKIYGSASFYQDDADSLLAPIKEFEIRDGSRIFVEGDKETGVAIQLKAKYKWFQVWFHKSRFDTNAPLSTFSIVGGDDSRFVTDRHIFRVAFEKMLVAGLTVSAQVDFDDYRFADGTVYEAKPNALMVSPATGGSGRSLTKMAAADRRWEARAQLSWVPNLKLSVIGGVEFEYLDILRWHFPEIWAASNIALSTVQYTNSHVGSFLQAQYAPIAMIKATAGVRFDYDEIYGAAVTPRAGVVLSLPAGLYIKGLFGMAFKGPSFHDLYYYRKAVFYGNPELDPENSLTGEAQLGWKPGRWLHGRVTGFYTKINKLIAYQSQDAGTALLSGGDFPASQQPDPAKGYSQKKNLDDVTTAGVEAELDLFPHRAITAKLQGTYRMPRDKDGNRLPYSSEWTAGGSVSLRMHRNLMVTFRALAVGDKEVPKRALSEPGFDSWATADDPTVRTPAYFMGTVMVRAPDLFNGHLDLNLKLDNITNQQYYDAGREVLYPQRGFQGMLWATIRL